MGTVLGSISLIGSLRLGTLAAQEQPADAGSVTFPIAGLSYDTAVAIFEQYKDQLKQLPGAQGAGLGPEGIVVFTENPDALPAQVEGIPVTAGRPLYPQIAGRPFKEVQAILERNRAALHTLSGVEAAVLGLEGIRVHTANPDVLPLSVDGVPVFAAPSFGQPTMHGGFVTKLLPPPSEVIVLRPGGRREQAEACPAGLMEVDGDYGWRFCVDLKNPEPIPLLWAAPLAGIAYDKVLDIYERHLETLFKLPGIQGYGLKADGLHVRTSQPEAVPRDLEGLPVIVHTVPEGRAIPPVWVPPYMQRKCIV